MLRVFVRVFHLPTSSSPRYFPSPSDVSFRCLFCLPLEIVSTVYMKRCLIYINFARIFSSCWVSSSNTRVYFIFTFTLVVTAPLLSNQRHNNRNSHIWEEDKSLTTTRWRSLHNVNLVFCTDGIEIILYSHISGVEVDNASSFRKKNSFLF